MKKLVTSVVSMITVLAVMVSPLSAATETVSFVQNTNTANGYGYVNYETDQFETYSEVSGSAGAYTSLSSKIYKPNAGDTLIVVFHGNGEGGVEGDCNNYSQIAANRLAVTYTTDEIQAGFHGAYVLAFQAPDYWYNDYTTQAKAIIDEAVSEFGINQVFVSGLSAGGLMTQRMLAKYGSFFDGALMSCAAISKNDQYVEGLGGDYGSDNGFLDESDTYTNQETFKRPVDYATYVTNYQGWLDAIAASEVPIFLVHCYTDTTIFYNWSVMAYDRIKAQRATNGFTGDVRIGLIEDVSYPNETFTSAHWSWIKMLNGDVYADDDPALDTMTWFTSLSTSTVTYQPKTVSNPTAGASAAANTYQYNLIANVTNSGEKVVAIEIDMNGKKVDASTLTTDMFKIRGYNEDASGLAVNAAYSFGIFEPQDIEVSKVSVNEAGNIVLELANQKGVLNYTSLLRNLATRMIYSIEPTTLTFVDEPVAASTTPVAAKTGDDSALVVMSGVMLLSIAGFMVLKREWN